MERKDFWMGYFTLFLWIWCVERFPLHLQEHDVETPYGRIHCTMKGVPKTDRPIILTMHDIGLNRKLLFSFSSSCVSGFVCRR